MNTLVHQSCRYLAVGVTAFVLSACGPTPSAVADRYDPAKMDLKPMPAKLSTERHTGPFAVGAALLRRGNRGAARRLSHQGEPRIPRYSKRVLCQA
jgi:hypothetical protein